MDELAADGPLIDVRGEDLASLPAKPGMKTALDRVLRASGGSCNDFNNSID